MSTSGIKPNEDIFPLYNKIKLQKTIPFVIFEIEGGKSIEIKYIAEQDETFNDFKAQLSERHKKPCYAILDFKMPGEEEGKQSSEGKLCFVTWCPDCAVVREKMLISSSKDGFTKKLEGIKASFQCCDMDDLDEKKFQAEIERGSRK